MQRPPVPGFKSDVWMGRPPTLTSGGATHTAGVSPRDDGAALRRTRPEGSTVWWSGLNLRSEDALIPRKLGCIVLSLQDTSSAPITRVSILTCKAGVSN